MFNRVFSLSLLSATSSCIEWWLPLFNLSLRSVVLLLKGSLVQRDLGRDNEYSKQKRKDLRNTMSARRSDDGPRQKRRQWHSTTPPFHPIVIRSYETRANEPRPHFRRAQRQNPSTTTARVAAQVLAFPTSLFQPTMIRSVAYVLSTVSARKCT